MPVAASSVSGTTLTDGDLSTNLDADGTGGDGTDTGGTNDESDGESNSTEETFDEGDDDGSDDRTVLESDDGSDGDQGSDADDDDTATSRESDADGGANDDGSTRERSELGSQSESDGAAGATDTRSDSVAAAVGDSARDTGYTGEGSDDAATAADLAGEGFGIAPQVDEAVDDAEGDSTLTLSIWFIELRLGTTSLTPTGTDVGGEDPSSAVVETAAPHDAGPGAFEVGTTSGDRGPTIAGAGPGEGGEPLPPSPTGAVMAVGALVAVAAVRHTPFVASGGARVATATGPSLLSTLLERLRPFVLPLRYSRYDDSDPLEHEAREQVYELVNEAPGSYLSEVSEEADLPLSTTRHHIKILEREQLVSGVKLRGKRRFYPAYAEGIELAAALNDDSTATIIDAVARFGAASVSDLADELGRDPSTISHHLQRLEEDGIVARERDGRAVVTRLSSEARTALEPESTPTPGEAGEALAGGAD